MLQVIPDLSQSHIHAHSTLMIKEKSLVTIKLFLDCAKSAVSTFEQVNIFYDTTLFHWLVSNTCITECYFVQNQDCYIYNTTKIADLAQPRKCSDFSLWEGP